MELVILFPADSSFDTSLLLRKDENGKYFQISDQNELAEAMDSLSLTDNDQKIAPGIIIESENYIELMKEAMPYLWELMCPNLILNVNTTCSVWFDSNHAGKYAYKIISKYSKEHQMILFKTDEPMVVSPDFNVTETDPKRIIVHSFSVDKAGKSSFLFADNLGSFKSDKKEEVSYLIVNEDGSRSNPFTHSECIKRIENMKKKFATILIKEGKLSEASSDLNVSKDDLMSNNAYKAAFESKLVGKIDVDKMRLLASIRDVSKNVKGHGLYSPTISICQGSGSGKSKLACSLESDLACAYVVFRKSHENAYPEKSNLGDLFVTCPLTKEVDSFNCPSLSETNIGVYCHLIYALLSDYLVRVKTLKRELCVSEDIKQSESANIRRLIMKEFIEGTFFGKELTDFENGIPLEILKSTAKNMNIFAREVQKLSVNIFKELDLPAETSPFVIILDEVHLLSDKKLLSGISRLRLLRRAMHALRDSSNVVFLTLGTKADYADLNPNFGSDSMRDDTRSQLYPHFIIARNTDIFRSQISKLSVSARMLKDPRMALVRFAMGRPLWCSLILSKVVDMAKLKLANSCLETGEALVACWMLSTGIPASPHMVDLSRHLVKSNMATLLDIHPTLPLMNVCYPSEPVLAIAANFLVEKNLVHYFQKMLNHLLCKGFDRGDLAKVLAADICIQAVQKADRITFGETGTCKELDSVGFINSKMFILENQINEETFETKLKNRISDNSSISAVASGSMKLTTLENFLKALFGDDYESLDLDKSISTRMLNGIVDFNHFIRLNEGFPLSDFFDKRELKKDDKKFRLPRTPKSDKMKVNCRGIANLGLKRGVAFFAPEDHPGTDLFIPVCVEDNESATEKSTLALLSIQVKAGSLNHIKKEECAKKMFLDEMIIKCSLNRNCKGCSHCETEENIYFLLRNQLAIVFSFGPAESKAPSVEKQVFKSTSSSITVIFNNGPKYLKNLWGDKFDAIIKIVNDIMAFSWLPHNFIDKSRGTGLYHLNQIMESYLDKPLFTEFSDLYREELGWPEIVNSNEKDEHYKRLIEKINLFTR